MIAGSPDATKVGPYVVRLTPEGSVWFHAYHDATQGAHKTPPTENAPVLSSGTPADWEPWVKAKLAFDTYRARQSAQAANLAVFPSPLLPETVPPPPPGPIPPGLLVACGNPPLLAGVYAPLQYTTTFDGNEAYAYTDNVKLPDRYAYYRFASGVSTGGINLKKMPQVEKDALFQATGFPSGEQHIWEAVSELEGGFDSVQTYDTGYVSVGFIQFVTMLDSKHDLTHSLLQEKADDPASYQKDFRHFGIDAYPDRTLVVVDPETGAELDGPDAVMKIIDDKRLLAVFQRAGRRTPFRLAQIKTAKADYWPLADPVTVNLPATVATPNGIVLTGTVGDVIHSEAGIATLLDRKINVGNCRIISSVVQNVMIAHNCPGKSLDRSPSLRARGRRRLQIPRQLPQGRDPDAATRPADQAALSACHPHARPGHSCHAQVAVTAPTATTPTKSAPPTKPTPAKATPPGEGSALPKGTPAHRRRQIATRREPETVICLKGDYPVPFRARK